MGGVHLRVSEGFEPGWPATSGPRALLQKPAGRGDHARAVTRRKLARSNLRELRGNDRCIAAAVLCLRKVFRTQDRTPELNGADAIISTLGKQVESG